MLTKLIKFIKPVKKNKYYDNNFECHRTINLDAIEYFDEFQTHGVLYLKSGTQLSVTTEVIAKVEATM